MKTTLLIAAIALGMIAAASAQEMKPMTPGKPSASALEAKVRKSWEQFKNKDKAGFAAGLAEGYRAVEDDGDGARDAKAEVSEIDDFVVSQYALTGFHVSSLGAGAALVTYTGEYSGTAGGQPVHDKIAVAEVWVKRGGDWKELYSQDTKVK
jgi:Domain of unknown function (DUF4440)